MALEWSYSSALKAILLFKLLLLQKLTLGGRFWTRTVSHSARIIHEVGLVQIESTDHLRWLLDNHLWRHVPCGTDCMNRPLHLILSQP